MSTEVTKNALEAVLTGMVAAFDAERGKTESFKEMFKAGSTYTGLLRNLKSVDMGGVLDACKVLEGKNVKITQDLFEFLIALPYLAYKLEREIRARDGSCCCVDKTFFLLSEELKRLVERG